MKAKSEKRNFQKSFIGPLNCHLTSTALATWPIRLDFMVHIRSTVKRTTYKMIPLCSTG